MAVDGRDSKPLGPQKARQLLGGSEDRGHLATWRGRFFRDEERWVQVILTACCFSVYLLKHPSSHPYPSAFPSRENSKLDSTSWRAFEVPSSCLSANHSEITPQHRTSSESSPALGEGVYEVQLTWAAFLFPLPHSMIGLSNRESHQGLVQSLQVSQRPGSDLSELTLRWNHYLLWFMPIKWQNQENKSCDTPLPPPATKTHWPQHLALPYTQIFHTCLLHLLPNSWQKWSIQHKTDSSSNGTSHLLFTKS